MAEATDPGDAQSDVQSLYRIVRRLARDPSDPDELVQAITLHPASRRRLRWACASVMGRHAARPDLFADMMQEATCLVTEKIQRGRLPYSDQGPQRFSGWLWTVWRNACRSAWKRYLPTVLLETPGIPFEKTPISSPDSASEEDADFRVQWAIERIESPSVRQAMMDWRAGLTGVESARLREWSTSWVSKLRARGIRQIRAILERDEGM